MGGSGEAGLKVSDSGEAGASRQNKEKAGLAARLRSAWLKDFRYFDPAVELDPGDSERTKYALWR